NPQLKLKPGMTANLTMVVDQHENVLTVPNSALRFRPAGVTQEKIAELLNPQGTPGAPAPAPTGTAAPAPTPQAEGSASVPPIPGAESAPRGNRGGGNLADGGGQRGRGNRGGGGAGGGGGRGGGNRGGGGRGGGGQGGRPQRAVLWTQDEMGQYKPIPVRTGLSDGTRTEVMGEGLIEGMEIVVSDLSQVTTTTPRPAQNNLPFGVPNFPGGGNRGRGGF
ncbi:MAG TPA: hypothetical protein VFO87_10545, partial [Nitrospira sp.]|nr:hypothetical protein [Nitrospira sp.]